MVHKVALLMKQVRSFVHRRRIVSTGEGSGRLEGNRLVGDAFNSRRPNSGTDNHDRGEGG